MGSQLGIHNPRNPFVSRGIIRTPSHFFGRRAELGRIRDRLQEMESVSVVGERRIGKSSLLHRVTEIASPYLDADVLRIYTDLPDVSDERSFYRRVCYELGVQGDTFHDLEQAVRGKRVIACLDEFRKVADESRFPRRFFDSLRSLAQSRNLALVVATECSLAELCRTEQIAASPFWNGFARLDLGLFSSLEAEEFVRTRFELAGVLLSDQEVTRVLELTGGFPFFLCLACFHLFEARVGRVLGWEEGFRQEAYDYLLSLWNHQSPDDRSALRWVLDQRGPVPQSHVMWRLERCGLLVEDDRAPTGFWFFCDGFRDIVSNPPRAPHKRRLPIGIGGVGISFGPLKLELKGTPEQSNNSD
jgi:hypothetical protein